jgi:hypothetical protein
MPKPFTIEFPPGMARTAGVDYFVKGRYSDGRFMRWVIEGRVPIIRPMKAWDIAFPAHLTGKPRKAHAWLNDSNEPVAGVGTSSKLYTVEGGVPTDITPAGFTPGDLHSSTWTIDSFSEVGLACNSEEKTIYEWTPGALVPATALTNAPSARSIRVTDQKILLALQADGDPRAFAWCDQEDLTDWTPTALNQAGDLPVHAVGALITATKIPGGMLLHTTAGVHRGEYIGRPDVYDVEHVANGCGIVGEHASISTARGTFWMSDNSFQAYRGFVEQIPCDIGDDVFSHLNQDHRHKVWTLALPEFSEAWFFYPRDSAVECSHAAIFNYQHGFWNHTEFPRLAGFEKEVFGYPVMASGEGRLLRHETGWDYDESVFLTADDEETFLTADDGVTRLTSDPGDAAAALARYLRSAPIELSDGDKFIDIDEFIPAEANQGDCDTYFHLRNYPNDSDTTIGPYPSADNVGVLREARQVSIEYQPASGVEDFRIGPWRVRASEGSDH